MKNSKLRPVDYILIVVCIVLMFFSYLNIRKRKRIMEVKNLPYLNISVENVMDGTYLGDVQTSFLCLKLEVTVKDKQLTSINVLEKSELKNMDEQSLFEKMIDENKAFVEVQEGNELPSLVYICCVDQALSKGVEIDEQGQSEN